MDSLSLIPILLLLSSHQTLGQDWTGEVLSSFQPFGHDQAPFDFNDVEGIMREVGRAAVREPDGQPLSLYLPVFADPASPCGVAVAAMASALEGNAPGTDDTIGVLRMVDSWAKVRDGFLYGLPFVLGVGSYGECLHARAPNLDIRGKYCVIVNVDNPSYNGTRTEIDEMLRVAQLSANLNIGIYTQYSTCIPDACSEEGHGGILNVAVGGRKLTGAFCETLDEPAPDFTAGDIAMISFLSLMLALLTAGTVADLYLRITSKAPATGVRFLLPFSAYTNLEKMFHVATEPRPGVISCLHGMRVLSMTWVIYGHQYIFDIYVAVNSLDLQKWTSGLLFQVIFNATVSTDSFFFLSGLLVSYGVLKEIKRTGKLNMIMYYVHRLIRLTPPIALVVLFLATLFRFLPRGPLAYMADSYSSLCAKNWWMDVLYVDNYLGFNKTSNQSIDCLGQCWYTAVDTQLYLVAPLVLLPLALYPSKGKILLFVVTLVSFIVPAAVIYAYDLPPGSISGSDDVDALGYQNMVYFTPWCRMSAYIMGIWTGYIIFEQGSKKLKLTPLHVLTGWTIAAFSALSVLLGMWSYNQLEVTYHYDPVTQVLYGGLHRGVWCAALAWVVVACHFGYGGIVNDFLSHPSWQPLSRLTYTMYLVAIPVQIFMVYNIKELPIITHIDKIIQTCGTIFISIVAAVLVSLTAEAPVLGLEKLIFKRPGRGEVQPQTNVLANGKQGHENLAFSDEGPVELEKKEMVEIETAPKGDVEWSLHQDSEVKETTLL
ncbi:LOW QUALITY PROTEIN: nose resistant to fluoxetine protein 6-like [Penaeus monodon]|uniref:LOW QUALITY PROTEIN: nose resistant to fluoxetine protein 6-like n=1 Tax=Penaeus monodon TaxID=6687 RepID=UPI0018A7A258|nr:LOW QUALITY PROTEIN: nose resistant to fluoxetine protein 6-like [Penaeus monodon]